MKNSPALPKDKKLIVITRVEPGCLGPQGDSLIDDFCVFARKELQGFESNYVIWQLEARHDKTQPEIHYTLAGKSLNHRQAEKYLAKFGEDLDQFEEFLNETLTDLIEDYTVK